MKGWGLPFAGDPLNHSALLTQAADRRAAHQDLCVPADDDWACFRTRTRPRPSCAAQRPRGCIRTAPRPPIDAAPVRAADVPDSLPSRVPSQHLHSGSLRQRAGRAGPTGRPAGRAHRHRQPGRDHLDQPRRLGQPHRRVGRKSVAGAGDGRAAPAALGARPGRPAHRAGHQRDEPVHAARPARTEPRAQRRAAAAGRARSTTRSCAAGSTR